MAFNFRSRSFLSTSQLSRNYRLCGKIHKRLTKGHLCIAQSFRDIYFHLKSGGGKKIVLCILGKDVATDTLHDDFVTSLMTFFPSSQIERIGARVKSPTNVNVKQRHFSTRVPGSGKILAAVKLAKLTSRDGKIPPDEMPKVHNARNIFQHRR